MKIIISSSNEVRLNKILDWILYIVGYTFVLYITDLLFNSLYVDNIIYDFIAAIIINILNKTIKPIIFKITIPITALSLGLFYPFINLFILKLTDWILGNNFDVYGIFWGLFVATMISGMNMIVEGFIINPIIRRAKKNE